MDMVVFGLLEGALTPEGSEGRTTPNGGSLGPGRLAPSVQMLFWPAFSSSQPEDPSHVSFPLPLLSRAAVIFATPTPLTPTHFAYLVAVSPNTFNI
jgi:hypothetical protein